MFTDERRFDVWETIRQHDIRCFSEQLTSEVLGLAAMRTGVTLVRSPLCLFNLVWLGIASALHAAASFATVLTTTMKLLEDQEQFPHTAVGQAKESGQRRAKRRSGPRSKHDPRRDDPTEVSEEAFAKARARMPLEFWMHLVTVLGERFEAAHGERHQFRGFRVLALDGTRINLPNCKALRDHFGTATNSSGAHNAQARLAMLQFPFTRLPYRYELAPVVQGEVTLALRLIQSLAPRDLVLLDAGFRSYQVLWAIAGRQAFFAVRLHQKLNFQTLRRLQPDGKDKLVRWTPKDSRGLWRQQQLPRSIDLRIVEYRVPGFRPQMLATNVLSPQKISRDEWTRLASQNRETRRKLLPGLYHRRWEIETSYRELKVDQGLDRHLRSRTPASIQYEVAGHLVLYLLVRWLIVEAARKHGLDPLRLSFVQALRELELLRPLLVIADPAWVTQTLLPRLLDRIAQHQVPYRPGRSYPRKKKHAAPKRNARKESERS